MADKLAVWNQALVHLEKQPLVSLTSDVEPRYVFDTAWPGVVEEAFNEGDWNFAKVSAQLDLNGSETPAIGWSYVFDYPDDYMRTVAVSSIPDFFHPFYAYVDQGGFLHSSSDVLYLRYISEAKMVDASVPSWPALFWRYVALKLAFETCGKLTGGTTLGQLLEKKMEKALRKAKNIDARNENNKVERPGSWLLSRGGTYGRRGGYAGSLVGGSIVPEEGDV
jgi:hypothetical protein